MVQGNVKKSKSARPVVKNERSAKVVQKIMKEKKLTSKGGGRTYLPNNKFRDEAIMDRQISQAINKSNEQKIAARVIQDGGKMKASDLVQKGKELNREQRRSQVKKKVSRVEEKLKTLRAAAEKSGKS
jgi:phage pi2 protein 07